MTDFFKGRTTITSRIERPNTLEPPTMTICFDPPFKTSVARQFGLVEHFDYRVLELPSGISYGQRFQKLSYLLDEDYKVKMSKMSLDKPGKNTSKIGEGSNTVNGQVFDVMQIQSSFSGTCLNIKPRFVIETGPLFINLYIKPTLGEAIDQMNRIVVYVLDFK